MSTETTRPAVTRHLLKHPSGAWVRAGAWLVLIVCSAGSFAGAAAWKGTLDHAESAATRSAADSGTAVVSSALAVDDRLVDQLAALFVTRPDMSNLEFAEWGNAAKLAERFPGGVGYGFIARVPASDVPSFASARAHDPVIGLTSSEPFTVFPATVKAEYCLQRLGMWQTTEIQGFVVPAGLDFCASDLGGVRSPLPPLLEAATDSGLPTVLPPSQLQPGVFAVYLPLYRGGVTPPTLEARRAESIGWATGSFQSAALTKDALKGVRGLAVRVTHGRSVGGAAVVVSSAGTAGTGSTTPLVSTVTTDSGWRIDVMGVLTDNGASSEMQALAIVAAGVIVGSLLFVFLRVLGSSRERALDLVEERTGDLEFQALHDSLTGLPNRALIIDRANAMLARAERGNVPVAAMFVDLDDFKSINDTLGHGAGDEVLKSVASRFGSALRASDTVGRIGGDEFVILLEGSSLKAGPEMVAQRVLDVLREPFMLGGELRQIAASIGIAAGPRSTSDEWLRDADIALYEAKAAGKNGYVVFESEMQQTVEIRVALEHDLYFALEEGQFLLHYQPRFDLRTSQTTGVEGLLRWQHPTAGLVMPDEFLPAAERSGLIVPIGRWVLAEACRQGADWNRRGNAITMSVNVSPRQLEHDDFVDDVRTALVESGLEPGHLMLEITEAALMRDASTVVPRLEALKALGVRLAIDDFGSEYSSMAHLRQFPVDVIKIDRSCVAGISDSNDAAVLVRTLVQFGKALGLETVAEGIEDDSQLDSLLRERCDTGQGFLYARPLAPADLETFLGIPSESALCRAETSQHSW